MEKQGVSIRKCSYEEIIPLRKRYLLECNCQIRYDSCHWRGWADHYQFLFKNQLVGYGAVKGLQELKDRDTIFEVFLIPWYRTYAEAFLQTLISFSKVRFMESQTNDLFTTDLIYNVCSLIASNAILFEIRVKLILRIRELPLESEHLKI